jgi:hypothetical protein
MVLGKHSKWIDRNIEIQIFNNAEYETFKGFFFIVLYLKNTYLNSNSQLNF